MNLLFVCSKNSGRIAPFILEQGESLVQLGIRVEYFTIEGKGWKGYLKNRKRLVETIKTFQPQVIHAHYGLSGLLANMQRRVPVVTTYHGSDINNPKVFLFSKLCMKLSVHNIFVSIKNQTKSALTKNFSLIPCGVDINLFVPFEKLQARKELGLDMNKKYVLFAGAFNNNVKNPELALSAVAGMEDVELLELKGYTRQQVVQLMNAVDAVLMTSFSEGSPQFIKEAMACNCPVVSVPVGDVPDIVSGVEGCYMTTYEPADVVEKLKTALDFAKRTEGRKRIIELKLDIESVAKKIVKVYRNE